MKRLATGLLLCLLMCLTLSSAVCAQGGNTVTLTEADNNGMVSLSVGDTLVVRLPSNPSTGYSWSVAQNNPGVPLQPIGSPSFERREDVPPGAPGVQVFRFRAAGGGSSFLRMIYHRPFEPGFDAARRWSAFVTITPNLLSGAP
jgi:inhibitor of cysteine peptidase